MTNQNKTFAEPDAPVLSAAGLPFFSSRTDSEALWPASNDSSDIMDPEGAYVRVEFARMLELENLGMRTTIESLIMQLEHVEWLREHCGPCSVLTSDILKNAKILLSNARNSE